MKRLSIALLLCFGSCSVFAQSITLPDSTMDGKTAIDGKKTPYLIPDLLAYRMVLLSLTAKDAGPYDSVRQKAILQQIDVPASQQEHVKEILSEFRSKYDDLQSQGRGSAHPTRGLKGLKDGLAEETVTKLKTLLTDQQTAQFEAMVREAKNHIITTETDSAQPPAMNPAATVSPTNGGGGGGGCFGSYSYTVWSGYESDWAVWNYTTQPADSGAGFAGGWGGIRWMRRVW